METTKPKVELIGQDGNIFNLVAIAARALKHNGQKENADKMKKEVLQSKSYSEALGVIMEYCEVE